jgi:hypothetical protein
LGGREHAVRERPRDGYRDAGVKSGAKRDDQRRSLEVPTWFAPLLRRVVALHPPDCRRIALALVASALGQRFTVHGSSRPSPHGAGIPSCGSIVRAPP